MSTPRSLLERLAADARAAFEASDLVPEGIELYRWWWVPVRARFWEIPVAERLTLMLTGPEILPHLTKPPVIEVRRQLHFSIFGFEAYLGWDEGERQAVLFFEDGGLSPKRIPDQSAVPDSDLRDLTREGAALLSEERLWELMKRLDELGFGDGEEWKRQ